MESAVADAPTGEGAAVTLVEVAPPSLPPSLAAYGLAAAAAAALLPTVFSPAVLSWTFTPKLAVLIVVGAIGAVPLVRLARSSQASWAARGAGAFLLIALVSALLSPSIGAGFFGLYEWGTGWFFWFGCAGAFALGACLRSDQLKLVLGGIVFAGLANGLIAIVQVAVHPGGALELYEGKQADGMLGNPIHLEALLVGVLALIAGRACAGARARLWWPLVLLVSAALELTLERAALPIVLVILVAALVVYGLRQAAPFVALTVAGYVAAYVSAGSGLGSRVAAGSSSTTFGTRLHIWDLALRSVVHHPLLGIGPGELISAIAPHMTASFAAHLGPGTLPTDSHDFLIEVLATTGLLGFVAFVTWIGGATLRARGPFLACAFAMLAVELIEPLNVGVTPVALLALGAATVSLAGQPVGLAALRRWRRAPASTQVANPLEHPAPENPPDELGEGASSEPSGRRRRSPSLVVSPLLVAAAVFLAITMVVGDHYMLTSYEDIVPHSKIATADDANRLLPYWGESAAEVAEAYDWESSYTNGGPAEVEEALAWYGTASGRFGANPLWPSEAGALELQIGDRAAAERDDYHALTLDPYTYLALEGLGTIAKQEGEFAVSLAWYRKALVVAPAANDLENLIRSDEARLHAS
ncbi:MAG TPA: O-antigen ligase family protein [Acidimicrobiales bacterium]|nr:O-antigen ligase family protein [Acidimicrobiales bacterium]